MGLLVVLITGDVSSTTTLVLSLPAVLLESGYSRAMEREADDYAADWLRANGMGTGPYAAILSRLQAQHGDLPEGLGYFSSHPPTRERLENLR